MLGRGGIVGCFPRSGVFPVQPNKRDAGFAKQEERLQKLTYDVTSHRSETRLRQISLDPWMDPDFQGSKVVKELVDPSCCSNQKRTLGPFCKRALGPLMWYLIKGASRCCGSCALRLYSHYAQCGIVATGSMIEDASLSAVCQIARGDFATRSGSNCAI